MTLQRQGSIIDFRTRSIGQKEFVIDLFCGAGGTSTGAHLSDGDITVTACVNHDEKAIESHRANHPNTKHFIEDIRNPVVVGLLHLRVNALRKLYPGCIITIWASLECTNFSKAKGGLPRDADSRTLADHLFMYLDALKPDYLMIENVVEFMSWGPLDEKGKPVSKKKGRDYVNWVERVKSRGYRFDWRELNSANFGAYTSRNRYFAQFAKGHLPIVWPQPTHAKNPTTGDLFGSGLQKWKAVKEVLDLTKYGISIFNRKKPLVEATLKRIYAGLVKFVANGDDSFIQKYYSGSPNNKVSSINGPAPTVRTGDGQAIIKCDFLLKYNSTSSKGVHVPPGVDEPCPTVAAQSRLGKVSVAFLSGYYGKGNTHNTLEPCPTVSTKDRFSLINAEFLVNSYSGGGQLGSLDRPAPTVLKVPKSALTTVHFILNPQYGNVGNSINRPCPVIIARQDKAPLGLITCEVGGGFAIPIYKDDSETMVKIKIFMAHFGIVDIKMRMLFVKELLQIQGFPKDYKLAGNQTEQKKFIGNAVEVNTAKAIFSAHSGALREHFNKVAA